MIYLLFLLFPIMYPDIWDMDAIYDRTNLSIETLSVDTVLTNDTLYQEQTHITFFSDTTIYGDTIRIEAFIVRSINKDTIWPVLIYLHGAGGEGSFESVQNYVQYGMSAISISGPGSGGSTGPVCNGTNWLDVNTTPKESWLYQYAYSAMRSVTLTREYSFMDTTRVGLFGFSAGGLNTAISSGVDSTRIKCAVVGSATGYMNESALIDGSWFNLFPLQDAGLTRDDEEWYIFCDNLNPNLYANNTSVPVLWIDGSQDEFFPINSQKLTYQMVPSNHRFLTMYDYDHAVYYNDSNGYYDSYCNTDSSALRLFSDALLWLFYYFDINNVSGLDTFYNPSFIDTFIYSDSIYISLKVNPTSIFFYPHLFVSYDSSWTFMRYEMSKVNDSIYDITIPYGKDFWFFAEVGYSVSSSYGDLAYFLTSLPYYEGDSLAVKLRPSVPPSNIKLFNRDINNETIFVFYVNKQIKIQYIGNEEKKTILEIIDVSGRRIIQKSIHVHEGKNTIYIGSMLRKGVYFVRINGKSRSFIVIE